MATSAGGRSPSRSARRQILEKVDKRTYLDDTLPLQATITTYKILQSHVVSSSHMSQQRVLQACIIIFNFKHRSILYRYNVDQTLRIAGT